MIFTTIGALRATIREALTACPDCHGQGDIDTGFYKRQCMKCRDANGIELFDEPSAIANSMTPSEKADEEFKRLCKKFNGQLCQSWKIVEDGIDASILTPANDIKNVLISFNPQDGQYHCGLHGSVLDISELEYYLTDEPKF